MAQSARAELNQAASFAERGWQIAQSSIAPTDPKMGTILHDYGLVLDRGGERSKGQEYFEKALQARLAARENAAAIESLASLAASFYDVGRYAESDERYRQANALAQSELPPLHPIRAEILRSWCRVLTSVGKLEESLRRCDESLAILKQRADADQTEQYRTAVNRGVTLALLGRAEEAREALRGAVKGLRETMPAHAPELLEGVRALGVTLVNANHLQEGAALLAASFTESRDALGPQHPDVVLGEGEYGVALALQGDLAEAEHVLKDFATKSETMRRLYGRDDRATVGVFSRLASTRMFLAKLMIGQGRCQEAFDWIETTKARLLVDRIAEHASLESARQSIQNRVGALERERLELIIQRERVTDAARQSEIDSKLREIEAEVARLAAGTQGLGSGQISPSQNIARHGAIARTALVSFGIVDDEVLVAVFRPQSGYRCTTLGVWDGITESMQAVRAVESTPGGVPGLLAGSIASPAQRVVQTGPRSFALIARAAPIPAGQSIVTSTDALLSAAGHALMAWVYESAGPVDHLIISADGVLHLIALDALKIDGAALISHFSITQVATFMSTVAPASRQSPAPAVFAGQKPFRMILFGDPTYSPNFDAKGHSASIAQAALAVRGVFNEETGAWNQLPASPKEVRALSASFGLVPGETVFTRGTATSANLRRIDRNRTLLNAQYLVFSAHAVADLDAPELSSVVLSQPRGMASRDAYFTAADLASLHLRTKLVYFSACETGYGPIAGGEGMLGLSVGALTAGSRATVNTLWSVFDASTAEFTLRFFESIQHGKSPEEALTVTKRQMMQDPKWRDPAYWAPYVLVDRW
jgi:tetratricopeptide (TPR) repeat protein